MSAASDELARLIGIVERDATRRGIEAAPMLDIVQQLWDAHGDVLEEERGWALVNDALEERLRDAEAGMPANPTWPTEAL